MDNKIVKKKTSIRVKFFVVIVSALIILALVMGGLSVFAVNHLSIDDSNTIMKLTSEDEALRFEGKLNIVKHSADMIYKYAEDISTMENCRIYTPAYMDLVCDFAVSVADRTDGAMAVYFRYNPEITGDGTSGFFWSKMDEDDAFKPEVPTDILAYEKDDIEHVGWFYIPKANEKAMWMQPYFNDNLGIFMISYVIPYYRNYGEFAGVIGMDIDFNEVIETFGDTKKNEMDFLIIPEEHVMYSWQDGRAASMDLPTDIYDYIANGEDVDSFFKIKEPDGSSSVVKCTKLSNNMYIGVKISQNDIFSTRNKLIVNFGILTLATLLVVFIVLWKTSNSIIMPLKKLTEITRKYSNGDWSDEYIANTGDEVQELSEGVSIMAKNTQDYIYKIERLARKDALTGLSNKTDYLETIDAIKENRHGKYDNYAVVVLDLNWLKRANDTYGHEAGDALIYEAGQYICRIFSHSPVFRIGGDEFAVILYSSDFDERVKLCQEFDNNMGYEVEGAFGVKLSISSGMAVSGEDGDDFDAIFAIADKRMYEKKKEMKVNR